MSGVNLASTRQFWHHRIWHCFLCLTHHGSASSQENWCLSDWVGWWRRLTNHPPLSILPEKLKNGPMQKAGDSRSEDSSFWRDSVICCFSSSSSVYFLMLLSSSGTLMQRCIGEISRSVNCSRWHLRSCSHHWNEGQTHLTWRSHSGVYLKEIKRERERERETHRLEGGTEGRRDQQVHQL